MCPPYIRWLCEGHILYSEYIILLNNTFGNIWGIINYRVYNGGDEGDNVSYNTQNPTGLSFLWQVISPTIIHSSICY